MRRSMESRDPGGPKQARQQLARCPGPRRDRKRLLDFLYPCLETWEARSLSGWLEAASSSEACARIDFIEPNIGFESAKPEPDGTVKVVANFALEACPPWAEKDDFETPVDFFFTRQELAAAAFALGRNLDLFPER